MNAKLFSLSMFMTVIPWGYFPNTLGLALIGLAVQLVGLFILIFKHKEIFGA